MFKICENTFVFAFHLSRVGCYFDGSPQICMRSSAGSDKDWIRGQAYSELIHELSPSKVKSVIRQIEKNLLLKKVDGQKNEVSGCVAGCRLLLTPLQICNQELHIQDYLFGIPYLPSLR